MTESQNVFILFFFKKIVYKMLIFHHFFLLSSSRPCSLISCRQLGGIANSHISCSHHWLPSAQQHSNSNVKFVLMIFFTELHFVFLFF